MSVAGLALGRSTVTWLCALVLGIGGAAVFPSLSKLEDPEFTIKSAVIVTPYPGATPQQVEAEVTERLESAIQQLPTVRELRSQSMFGQSRITVDIRKDIAGSALPQVWDELRRKVGDAQGGLPPGAGPSLVNDDFGDVYGVVYALTGDGFTMAELDHYARDLRRDLLTIDGVAKVAIAGAQREVITVSIPSPRRVALGLSSERLATVLAQHNTVRPSGSLVEDGQRLNIIPDGANDSLAALRALYIPDQRSGALLRLGDVAEVHRGYADPPQHLLRYNGQAAVHIGISTLRGGNVVAMGEAVQAYIERAQETLPLGLSLHVVSLQGEAVRAAINDFLLNLLAAVAIVIGVLLLVMGWRAGLIIGLNLLLTVLGTLLVMYLTDIALQRVSLGALIIAMGMLVDNAIVVVDGVLARRQRGEDSQAAAIATVGQTQWPLLLATIIAILAFSAIGLSQDSTGEFTRSLFLVVLYSLFLSWLLAITLTPLLCVQWLGPAVVTPERPLTRMQRWLRSGVSACIRWRSVTVSVAVFCFMASVLAFPWVKQSFFPASARAQFQLNMWFPAATDIATTEEVVAAIDAFVREQPEVQATHASVGQGMLRFLLTYDSQQPHPAFAQLVVDVQDVAQAQANLFPRIRDHLRNHHPEVLPHMMRFRLGPGSAGAVGVRISGPDASVLRSLADQVRGYVLQAPDSANVQTDWRERVPTIEPHFNQQRAGLLGVSREQLAHAVSEGSTGRQVGILREGEDLIPILTRSPPIERQTVNDLSALHVIDGISGRVIPVLDVIDGIETRMRDGIIARVNRKRAITVSADPMNGLASDLRAAVRDDIEALPLPEGYDVEWVGEYKNSSEAQAALLIPMAVAILAMFLLLIVLFNALRPALVIFAAVPLCVIGVVFGLLFTGSSFGFMPLLGLLSLIGMLIKNGIVLVDEIQVQRRTERPDGEALVEATLSRVSPVLLAAGTTILGMLPLVGDVFFADMAVAIMAGLGVASLLTLLVIPALYSIVYGIRVPPSP